jgi:O-antigen/teichoic acid export membrane protein
LFARTTGGIVVVAALFSALIFLFGKWVLILLYGEQIGDYSYLLGPAVLCTFITAFAWFLNDLLLSLRDYHASFLGNMIPAIVSLIITKPLVDFLGMNGVSFVGAGSYLIAVILLTLFFVRDCKKLDSTASGDEPSEE